MRQQMQMYLLVGVMVPPKTVKIIQNMFKALLVAIALKGFLFAQGFEIKSFQVSASGGRDLERFYFKSLSK